MSRPSRAFTLVELLVVLVVISVLVALLLPSLQRSKEVSLDVRCGVNMRQTLTAIAAYNTDFRYGLKNLNPGNPGAGDSCPYFNARDCWFNNFSALPDWAMGAEGTAHFAVMTGWSISYGSSGHGWDEARNLRSHWRGYLLAGKYARAEGLGCNASDYSGERINGWSGQWQNIQEPVAWQKSLQKTPPYQWWGPGVMSWYQGAVYTGGNHSGLIARFDGVGPAAMFLLNCPTVNLGVSPFTPGARRVVAPHRPRLGWDEFGDTFGPTTEHPMNLGYTDGSVKFVDNKGGWVDYNTLH